MGKRLSDIPTFQWLSGDANHQCPANLILYLITAPLFILAILLLLDGVFSFSVSSLAIGVIGLAAAFGINHHGRGLQG